jgi:hypothetical protein
MPEPIPLRRGPATPPNGRPTGPARGLGSPRPPAYRHEPTPPLRWHARWPRPHPLVWAVFGCVVFWWTVICAVRF